MMSKNVLLFDIDRTCYNGLSQQDLMKAEIEAGFYSKEDVDAIVASLKGQIAAKQPYEALAEDFTTEVAKLYAGCSQEALYQHAKAFYTAHIEKLSDFLPDVLQKYHDTHDAYLLSGGFEHSVRAIADIFAVTGFVATTPEVVDGVYQDEIRIDMSYASDKEREAKKIMARYPLAGSIAFGDASADEGMMRHTQYGICVNPEAELRADAPKHDWFIIDDRTQVFAKVVELLG